MISIDKSLVGDALSLPVIQRVELVELLLASLDKPDISVDQLWAEESESRIDAYEFGKLKKRFFTKCLVKI